MERVRSVLEVLKFTSPRDSLLHAATLSTLWLRCTEIDELWLTYCEMEGIDFWREDALPAKDMYRQYIRQATSLLLVQSGTVVVISTRDLTVTTVALPVDTGVTCENGYCFVKPFTIVCFGASTHPSVCSVNIRRQIVTALPSMATSRMYPGLIPYQHLIYVFGGNTDSCEKLNLRTSQWEIILARLSTSVIGSQPVRSNSDVFILSKSHCEVFSLLSETFTQRRISLPLDWWYSLAFVCDADLVVIQRDVIARWEIASSSNSFRVEKMKYPLGLGYYSNCPTVRCNGKFFALHNDIPRVRGVLSYDPQASSLRRVLALGDPNYLED